MKFNEIGKAGWSDPAFDWGAKWVQHWGLHPIAWGSTPQPSNVFIPNFLEDCNEYFKERKTGNGYRGIG
jgi:hypothetical protein